MSIVIPPWLRPADALESIQAGAQSGLALRAAQERERAAAVEEGLARERLARDEQSAAEKLRFGYEQMGLEAYLKEQERAARMEANELDNATRLKLGEEAGRLKQANADALAKYREETLKLKRDESTRPAKPRTYQFRDRLVVDRGDGQPETIFTLPPETGRAPMVSGVPLTKSYNSPKIQLRADDPMLNTLLPTDAAKFVGTNYSARLPAAPAALQTPAPAQAQETPDQVRELFRTGKISKDEALKRLRVLGME